METQIVEWMKDNLGSYWDSHVNFAQAAKEKFPDCELNNDELKSLAASIINEYY